MKTVTMSEFRKNLDAYILNVGNEPLIITKYGKAVAVLKPFESSDTVDLAKINREDFVSEPQ